MSTPFRKMRPSSGWSAPLMQLKSVVLPAPLGPMRPTISRGSMVSDTSWLATRPPKRLVHDVTSSSGVIGSALGASALGRLGRRAADQSPGPARPRQREQPVGPAARDEHDDGAVDDEVDAAAGQGTGAQRGRHELRDRDQDDRAQD